MSQWKVIVISGVLIGSGLVISKLIEIAYAEYLLNEAMRSAAELARQTSLQTANALEQMRIDSGAREEALRQRARNEAILAQQRAEQRMMEQKRAAEQERRKETAWDAFYEEPTDCLTYQSKEHMVECTNARMRKRQEFEQAWKDRRNSPNDP